MAGPNNSNFTPSGKFFSFCSTTDIQHEFAAGIANLFSRSVFSLGETIFMVLVSVKFLMNLD